MSDKISVILTTRIANIGKEGDIIEVSRSQAKNYLIPKGFAKEATPAMLKSLEEKAKKQKDLNRMRLEESYKIQEMLNNQTIEFTLRGSGNKIFGWVNEHDIIEKIRQKFGFTFERHDIKLPNDHHIKTSGIHTIYIHITHNTVAKLSAHISISE